MTGSSLPAARKFGKILRVLLESLEFAFGVLVGDALRSAHGGERLQDCVVASAKGDEGFACRVAFEMSHAQQQMFCRDILVLEVRGFAKRLLQSFVQIGAGAGLRRGTCDTRQFLLDLVQVVLEALGRDTDLFQHRGDDALAVLDQRQQQVDGLHLGVAESGSSGLRLLHRLLRLQSEFVPIDGHVYLGCQ